MSNQNPYERGLDKNPANYVPLSPLTFIERAASVYPEHPSLVHGGVRHTWSQSYARCRRLASALAARGLGEGDTVSVMAFNGPAAFEAHFGVPMTGAVLHMINIRLDAKTIAFTLQHCGAKVLLTDRELSPVISDALGQLDKPPIIFDIDDPHCSGGEFIGEREYEALLEEGDPEYAWDLPKDEWKAISLGYTSGTTGRPKGVVSHHRGAYLNAISNLLAWDMPKHSVYLWTLPMFHCNGWCFPWTLAANVGTNVCLRRVQADTIYELIAEEKVTHYCGAPIVHRMLVDAPPETRARKKHSVKGMIAAAPPPPAVLSAMEENDFEITHVYGLTETYGPATLCDWHHEWDGRPIDERAELKARQGVRYHMLEALRVADPKNHESLPRDGKTLGEIFMRGNTVMMGYLGEPEATQAAFEGGWFHTGDLGVMHPDGYVQIKDRSKDIIISGGENISTIEVEDVLYRHPSVMEAAVVACPDEKWGETPCAFIHLRDSVDDIREADIIEFCRNQMAHYKIPKHVVFGPLPKTSTGKTQKFKLREKAREIYGEPS